MDPLSKAHLAVYSGHSHPRVLSSQGSGPAKLRLVGSSVHSPRLLHGVMHVARPSASVSSRSSVGAISREPVQGVALLCPPAVARPSLRPPPVRVRRKDASVVTVATQCPTTLSWAVWPDAAHQQKLFLFSLGGFESPYSRHLIPCAQHISLPPSHLWLRALARSAHPLPPTAGAGSAEGAAKF